MTDCVVKFHPRSFFVATMGMDAQEKGVLISMLSFMWSREGHVEDDEKHNARVCGVRPTSYRKVISRLVSRRFLVAKGGRIYPGPLVERMISRVSLTAEQRTSVLHNADRCTYCGTTQGPFVAEHIYPASRGGTNHSQNLTPACVPCNTRKRDILPDEWEGLLQ